MATVQPIRIYIAGTDRTGNIPVDGIRYSDAINNEARTIQFRVLDGASLGLATGQTVVITDANDATAKYFSGTIATLEPDPEGVRVDYEIAAIDDVFWLEGGEALVDGAYDSMTDAAIIADFMATTNSYIDATTNVVAVATISHIEFDNETPRQALERIAEIAGARWFMDDDGKLHYFAGDWQMPIVLTDDSSAVDEDTALFGTFRFSEMRYSQSSQQTYIFYGNFKRIEETPAATKVVVYGTNETALATVTGTAIGGRHRTTKLVNRDIQDASQATTHGQALLDRLTAPTIELSIHEPWLRAGWSVRVVNSLTNTDDWFIINSITHRFLGGGYMRSDLQLGRYLAPLPKILADVQRAVSGGSKAGARGGGASGGGVPALGHGHAGGADGPPIGSGGIDGTDPIQGDKLAITLDGVSWPAGNPGDIDLDSPNATVLITPDDANKTISFDVIAGALPYGTPALTLGTTNAAGVADTLIRTDATILVFDATVPADVGAAGATGSASVAARRDHVHRGVTSLTESTGITITGANEPYGALTIAADFAELTRYAFKTVTGDTGSAIAEIVDDSLAIVGGDGVTTTASDVAGADQVSVAVDFASTSTDVSGSASAGGSAVNAAREDHTHQGVSSLVADDGASGEANLHGDISVNDAGIVTVIGTEPSTLTISGPGYGGVANIQDVGSANAAGTNTAVPHADHVHKGVHSIAKSGDMALYGDVTLSAGANITLTEASQNIEIAVTTGSFPTAAFTNITDGINTAVADSITDTLRIRGTGGTTVTAIDDDPTYGDVVTIDSHSGHSVSGNTGGPSATIEVGSGTHTHSGTASGTTGSGSNHNHTVYYNIGNTSHSHDAGADLTTQSVGSNVHKHESANATVGDHGSHGHSGTVGWQGGSPTGLVPLTMVVVDAGNTSINYAGSTNYMTELDLATGQVSELTTAESSHTHSFSDTFVTGGPSATDPVGTSTHKHSGTTLTITTT